MKIDLTSMITESRNPASADIDSLPTLDMLRVINREDQTVALAVEKTLPQVAQVVDAVAGIPSGRTADLYGCGYLRPSRDTGCQ